MLVVSRAGRDSKMTGVGKSYYLLPRQPTCGEM